MQGRLTDLIETGKLFADLGPAAARPRAGPGDDLRQSGAAEGYLRSPERPRVSSSRRTSANPAITSIERAFVEK